MDTITFRQGETVPLPIEIDDDQAVQAIFTVTDSDDVVILQITEPFVDNVANIELSSTQTLLPVGTYNWQITIDYGDDKFVKLPDNTDCEECGLPELIVCAANDLDGVS